MTFILPNKTRVLWQLRIAAAIIFICITFLIVAPLTILILTVILLLCVLGAFLIFIYIPIFVKNYKIEFNNGGLCINKGVIIKKIIILPQTRLVFVQNIATPIMARLNLEVVMLKVAKGWVIIPEIEKSNAQKLLHLINGEHNGKK